MTWDGGLASVLTFLCAAQVQSEFVVPRRFSYSDTTLTLRSYTSVNQFSAPGKTNSTSRFSKACRNLDNNEIGPLKQDATCHALFSKLTASTMPTSDICTDGCFPRYMLAYESLEAGVCLESNEMVADNFRSYVCQQAFAPSAECDTMADVAMQAMLDSEVCSGYAVGLMNGAGLSPCNGTCFRDYIGRYKSLWDLNCFRFDLGLAIDPVDITDTDLCVSPSPSPSASFSPVEATPEQSHVPPVQIPTPSITPSNTPSMSVSESPTVSISAADSSCDLMAMQQLGPLRSTVCKVLLGDGVESASHASEVCNAPCFAEYLAAYARLHDSDCLVGGLDRDGSDTAEHFRASFCGMTQDGHDLTQPTLVSGRNGTLSGKIEATLSVTLLRVVVASAFDKLYSPVLAKGVSSVTGVAANKISVTSVTQAAADGSLKVMVQVEVPVAGVGHVQELLYESVVGVVPQLRTVFNRELTAQSSSLQATSIGLLAMEKPAVLPACEGSIPRALTDCSPPNMTRGSMCNVAEPTQACCAAVFHIITNGCDSGDAVCDESWPVYFDERCIRQRGLSSRERHTLTIDKFAPGQGTDSHGCVLAHNYSWCESKHTCVQNTPGGVGYPCPVFRKICRTNCTNHGVCLGNNTCACTRGHGGRACQVECPGLCYGNGHCSRDGECQCDEGWKGRKCEYREWQEYPGELTSDCLPPHPRFNVTYASQWHLCNGRGLCQNHRCHCVHGYAGAYCERQVFLECPKQCSDHGERCIFPESLLGSDANFIQFWGGFSDEEGQRTSGSTGDRACLCKAGYAGEDCSLWTPPRSVCPKACSGHGMCGETGCICYEGFMGNSCDTPVLCASNCSGHGSCVTGKDPECHCEGGYSGVACQVYADSGCPLQCSGAGRCDHEYRRCICKRGFDGIACTKVTTSPICDRCKHGTCVSYHKGNATNSTRGKMKSTWACRCEHGWRGGDCDEPYLCAAVGFCSGRGVCNHESATCDCLAGFSGQACDHVPELCPGFCSGHGRCKHSLAYDRATNTLEISGECVCEDGWAGDDCSRTLCRTVNTTVCNGHGVCEQILGRNRSTYGCTCDEGWSGQGCAEKDEECPGTPSCTGHGSCMEGVCLCNDGWGGMECSEQTTEARLLLAQADACCPAACSENGACIDCQCHCDDGWTGASCATYAIGDDMSFL